MAAPSRLETHKTSPWGARLERLTMWKRVKQLFRIAANRAENAAHAPVADQALRRPDIRRVLGGVFPEPA
jgi:hypothetical protein